MWSAEAASGPQIELRVARAMRERVRLAKFMACQFFSSQPGHVQGKIARASAQPAGLKLYEAVSVEVRRGPLGAVMLHSTDGVVGLYNLCIGIPYRSRGFGGGIIRAVQAIAAHEGAQVGLQCDSQLESWYSRFGMERAGFVSVFGLDR